MRSEELRRPRPGQPYPGSRCVSCSTSGALNAGHGHLPAHDLTESSSNLAPTPSPTCPRPDLPSPSWPPHNKTDTSGLTGAPAYYSPSITFHPHGSVPAIPPQPHCPAHDLRPRCEHAPALLPAPPYPAREYWQERGGRGVCATATAPSTMISTLPIPQVRCGRPCPRVLLLPSHPLPPRPHRSPRLPPITMLQSVAARSHGSPSGHTSN